MKTKSSWLAVSLSGALPFVLFFSGCTTRSISNSDPYGGRGYYYGHGPQAGGYQGELSEFDVLGVDRRGQITDADIASTLATVNTAARLTRASRILLIQSGADFPDAAMHEAMQQHFHVASFPGKPVRPPAQSETARNTGAVASPEQASYSKSLRLTAAQGGYDKIVCYWGQLESAEVDQATKIISWIPIIGQMIPDKKHIMRIVLKAAIIDVATGRWTFVMPPPATSSDLSTQPARENADQVLVNRLKSKGYQDLARMLFDSHTT